MVRGTGFRFQVSGVRLMLSGLVLLLAPGTWHPAPALAQVPAGTPVYNVNAKWVTDHGSQVFNVKAYASGSSTGGIQEAITAAGANSVVLIPPGTYTATAQILVQQTNLTISGYGATLTCNVAANCILIGNPSNGLAYSNITLEGLTISPGASSPGYSAIEDNAQGTHLVDIKPLTSPSYTNPAGGYVFANFIQFDNDQSFKVDKLNFGQTVLSCTASQCGAAIYGMQGSSYAALGTVADSNLSMGCDGNSINWGGGALRLVGNVIQAYSEAGIIGLQTQAGGLQQVTMQDGDNEPGNCTNPLGNVGKMGVLMQGRSYVNLNTPLGGAPPVFPQNGTTGSTWYQYYISPYNSTYGRSSLMPIGYLTNGNASISATNSVTVTWPAIPDATSYDLLRQVSNTNQAPTGTGNFAVATSLSPATYCTAILCTYTDTVTTPTSYSVQGIYGMNYIPALTYWPGSVVLTVAASTNNCYPRGSYFGDIPDGGEVIDQTSCSFYAPHVFYTGGQANYTTDPYPFSPLVERTLDSYLPGAESPALVLPSLLGYQNGLKGRINLGITYDLSPTDLITIYDSNRDQTIAYRSHRPSYAAGDAAICQDNASLPTLCLRSPNTLSFYLDALPTGSGWAARFDYNSGSPLFRLAIPMTVGGGTSITEMNLYSTASITPTPVSAASCSDQTFSVTGLATSDRISNVTPPSSLGNVSVSAYASASGTVLLHFCNPSSSSVTPPAGVYSFLAVH